METEWRAINQAMATFFIATLSWCIFLSFHSMLSKNAPSVTRSHDSQLFVRPLYCSWGLQCKLWGSPQPHPHEVKCTMEMWLLATSVYPSFEFSSIFLLSMQTDCSSRLIKDGRKRRFKIFCPTAAGLRVDRQWLYHHPHSPPTPWSLFNQ